MTPKYLLNTNLHGQNHKQWRTGYGQSFREYAWSKYLVQRPVDLNLILHRKYFVRLTFGINLEELCPIFVNIIHIYIYPIFYREIIHVRQEHSDLQTRVIFHFMVILHLTKFGLCDVFVTKYFWVWFVLVVLISTVKGWIFQGLYFSAVGKWKYATFCICFVAQLMLTQRNMVDFPMRNFSPIFQNKF